MPWTVLRNRHHLKIQIRSEPLVEPQFLLTQKMPHRQGGGIQKFELDALLHLVGILAGENHPGNVSFTEFDVAHRVSIGCLIQQRVDVKDGTLSRFRTLRLKERRPWF